VGRTTARSGHRAHQPVLEVPVGAGPDGRDRRDEGRGLQYVLNSDRSPNRLSLKLFPGLFDAIEDLLERWRLSVEEKRTSGELRFNCGEQMILGLESAA
jgi:hypothetical protein